MKSINRQAGISFIVMLVLVGLFGYAIYIGIKLAPVYMEYFTIKSSIDGLAEEMKTRNINKNQAKVLLLKRLDSNYIHLSSFKPRRDGCEKSGKEAYIYKKTKKDILIGIGYEKRVPIIANVDALLNFEYVSSVPIKR